jgi:pimeloyl-ACP methyl ester carboxylesterase
MPAQCSTPSALSARFLAGVSEGGLMSIVFAATYPERTEALLLCGVDIDARDVVPAVRVPTLILHRVDDPVCHVENARPLSGQAHSGCGLRRAARLRAPTVGGRLGDRGRDPGVPDRCARGTRAGPRALDGAVHGHRRLDRAGRRTRRPALARPAREPQRCDSPRARTVSRPRARHRGGRLLASFDGPARAIRCARAAIDAVHGLGLEIRAGVHTGECEVVDGKLAGVAMHIGARVAGKADPGELLVSGTVHDLVAGSGIEFEDRGTSVLKGVRGEWQLFAVSGGGS